jgi:hypothetical protein
MAKKAFRTGQEEGSRQKGMDNPPQKFAPLHSVPSGNNIKIETKAEAKTRNMKRTHFKKIAYEKLNARHKKLFNFQNIAATLADYGFNCIKLSDDWQGADFLAYHVDGTTTLRVQLKSRLNIQEISWQKHLDGIPAQGHLVSDRT